MNTSSSVTTVEANGRRYDAIVIGAGHNGLIAAAYLAREGKRVLVLERREIVGGACVTEEVWEGYRVSTAAYLCSLLLPEIVADLKLADYGFDVYRRETSGFAPFPDGSSALLYPDAERTRQSLTEFCAETPADVDAYFQLEADIEAAAEVLDHWMTREPPSSTALEAAFSEAGIAHLCQPFLTGSVRDLLDARFADPRLKAILATDGLIGTYGGPSTPGTAYVLLHHYLGRILGSRGAWGYVRGGMGRITEALAQVVRAHGGEIRTLCPVAQLLLSETQLQSALTEVKTQLGNEIASGAAADYGVVCGVRLVSGEEIYADVVLSNADPHRTFVRLMAGDTDAAPGVQPTENREAVVGEVVTARSPGGLKTNTENTNSGNADNSGGGWGSRSGIETLKTQGGASAKINLAVTELPQFTCLPLHSDTSQPGVEHFGTIHLCPDIEFLERAWEEALRGYPSTEPMIEMYLQTATDSSLAPPGRHILSLFVQYFPYNLAPGLDIDIERELFADRVIAIIGRYAPNVPGSILHRQILTPRDLEARFGLTGGHIFHGDLLPPNLWDTRPDAGCHGARTPYSGLYLCGSGAHPGGCVYGAPGYNAAQAVLADTAARAAARTHRSGS